ncbi:MAG: NFACT family protein [Ignavibacteriae bacterium]|nr:NFACT family protein [Ignavibacteriota bacterium]
MITHYFTLKALAQELDIVLRGAIVAQSYSQQKNELIIAVDVAGEESSSLAVSVNPAFNYMYFRQRTSRARKNVVDLFHESIGTKVDRVVVQSHDRVVAFELEGGSTLLFQLYNTAASNILLIDREKNIRDSFKRKGELLGTTLPSGEERFTERVLDDRSTFRQMMRRDSTQQALAALKQTVPVLGTVYAREILFTIGMDEKLTVETLADIDMEKIQDEVKRIVHDIGLPKPRVYFKDRQPVFLSLIPLQHFSSDYTVEEFKQVNDAAAVFVARSFRIEGAEEEKSRLLGKLQDILTRASRSLNATHEQLEKATPAEEYARFGQLIMANIHVLSKGMKEITVDDFFSGNGYVTIALEPHLLPAKNAERYFEKAKKTRIARKESEERLAERTKQVNRLEGLGRKEQRQ